MAEPTAPIQHAIPGVDLPPPPDIPGYELIRPIGQGSYGEVWLARSAAGSYRAVKIVFRKTFDHIRPFERELSGIQKFEPVSRSHASQVNILQVGRNDPAGYFFYVMELGDDANAGPPSSTAGAPAEINPDTYVPKTLKSETTRRGRLPFGECLDISLALTTALEHLHQHELIHRDIKPSNVIFVNGVPKLADIGLVTDVGASISYVGTEGFLPPEGPGTAAADIYSLGKVLYEISTGRDRLEFPELPTDLGVPEDRVSLLELNLVFLKACQNDTRKRYQSAREMAADLALLRGGKSLKRTRALELRLARATKTAAAAAALVILTATGYHLFQRHQQQKWRAEIAAGEKSQRIAEKAAKDTRQLLANSYVARGDGLAAQGDLGGALLCQAQALRLDHDDPARGQSRREQMDKLWRAVPGTPTLGAHQGTVNAAVFSSDGRRFVTASDDQTAQVWNTQTGEPAGPRLRHKARVLHAAIHGYGQRVVTADASGTAQIWNTGTGDPAGPPLNHGRRIFFTAFNSTGKLLLTLSDEPNALVWDPTSGRVRFTLKHLDRIHHAAFSLDGRYIATASADGTAQLWEADDGDAFGKRLLHDDAVNVLAFSPDSRRLATASGGTARVWNVASGEAAFYAVKHDAAINTIAFGPDARRLLTASEDGTARVWHAVTGKLLVTLRHPSAVKLAAFHPDGRILATACANQACLWDAATGERLGPPLFHNERVTQLQFSPDGDSLLTASADHTARVTSTTGLPARPSVASWPVDQLIALGQFASGREIGVDGQIRPLKSEAWRAVWQKLHAKHGEQFAPADVAVWHRREATLAETNRQWFAARFHWDRLFTARPSDKSLRDRRDQAALEWQQAEALAARDPEVPRRIAERVAGARAGLLDLTGFYNAGLSESWLPSSVVNSGNDLSALPRGVQKLGGVEFDVRGLIQLSGGALENLGGLFPRQIRALPVNQKCRRLHFLHGAAWNDKFGTHIGSYHINYAGGLRREVRIVFGENIRDWWFAPGQQAVTPGAAVAWEGGNAASRELGLAVRIYQMSWVNPLPDVEVLSIDFRSAMAKPAPFLIAISAE